MNIHDVISRHVKQHQITFEFILSTVIWYDLLNAINKVSKTLQSEKISINFALKNYIGKKIFG